MNIDCCQAEADPVVQGGEEVPDLQPRPPVLRRLDQV